VGGTDFRVLTYEVKGGAEAEAPSDAETKDFARHCLSELLVQAEASRDSEEAPPVQPTNGSAGGS
jgi:hypothetical protein